MLSEEMLQFGTKPSCIRELFEFGLQRAKEVGAENIFDFSLGNPSIPAPPEVNAAIMELVQREDSLRLHGYTTARGAEETREAIAADLNERYGTKLEARNLFLTCGAAPAVVSAIRALAVTDYEVLVIAPYFPEYTMYAASSRARLKVVPADKARFQIDVDRVEEQLSRHTQAIIVNSPNNPSGAVYTRETLQKLADLLEQKSAEYGHPIYIIADEPYRELVYDGVEVPFIPTIYRNTIVCYSYSKSLSLPGERLGYACVMDEAEDAKALLAAIAGAARTLGHVCAPSLLQRVVAKCARVRPNIEAYDRNRQALYLGLTQAGYQAVKPEGAFYMFVKAPGGDAQSFSDFVKEKNLLIVPGNDFGAPDYFRLSTCVPFERIERSLPYFAERIQAWNA